MDHYRVRNTPDAELGDDGKIVGFGKTRADLAADFIRRVGDTHLLHFNKNDIEIGNPAGACHIDSGSPLFTDQNGEWTVNGIASYIANIEICSPTEGSYYTNTVLHRDWLDEQVREITGHGLDDGTDTDSGSDSDVDTDTDTDTDTDGDGDSDDADDDDDDNDNDNDNNDDGDGCGCATAGKISNSVVVDLLTSMLPALR